jgi:Zn-dependent peptidase ImmA (M78 family)
MDKPHARHDTRDRLMERVRRLTARLREEYAVPASPEFRDMLQLCRRLGVQVVQCPTLRKPGYFMWVQEIPVIVVRAGCSALVLAHELFHALFEDPEEPFVVYGYPDRGEPLPDEEAVAEEFARLLCGA